MAPTPKTCEYSECDWKCEAESLETFLGLYKIHVEAKHKTAQVSTKVEKAKRPELASEVSDEDWAYFKSRWLEYKKATNLTSAEDILVQLMECCCEQLRRDHHRMFLSSAGNGGEATEETRLKELKQIAVRKRNKAVNRVKLTSIKQDRGEPVRKFAGRVRSLAAVSEYSVKCGDCQTDVSYTDQVIMDQIINGLADTEIQRDVLSHADSDTMTLETLLIFVEGKESGLSSQGLLNRSSPHSNSEVRTIKCRWCGSSHVPGKSNCKAPGHKCQKCGKIGHFEKVCRSRSDQPSQSSQESAPTQTSSECSIFMNNKSFIYPRLSLTSKEANKKSFNLKERPARACIINKRWRLRKKYLKKRNSLLAQKNKKFQEVLGNILTVMVGCTINATSPATPPGLFDHHVYDRQSGWEKRDPKEKPYAELNIEFDHSSAQALNMRKPSRQTRDFTWSGLCDTGASVTMAGRNVIRRLGLEESHITPCSLNLNNADSSPIQILGVIPVNITDRRSQAQTKQILYVTSRANAFSAFLNIFFLISIFC